MSNPLIEPSSILPALSGLYESIGYWPEGYDTWEKTQELLNAGGGLLDGNFKDYRQHRDYNANAGLTNPNEILGKPLDGFPDAQAGLNKRYTSPESYKFGNAGIGGPLHGQSGIFITQPPFSGGNSHPGMADFQASSVSGIFNFKEFLSNFSNAKESKDATGAAGIDDFTIFNDYVHYLAFPAEEIEGGTGGVVAEPPDPVKIPFVADLIPTKNVWDRYGSEVEDEENSDSDPSYGDD